MSDINNVAIDSETKSPKQTKLSRSQMKKKFVYNPSQDQEKMPNQNQIQRQKTQEKNVCTNFTPNKSNSNVDLENSKNESQKNAQNKNARKNKNKMAFVYNPQQDQEIKSTNDHPIIEDFNPVQKPIQVNTESDKKNAETETRSKENVKKNSKKQFVYNPADDIENKIIKEDNTKANKQEESSKNNNQNDTTKKNNKENINNNNNNNNNNKKNKNNNNNNNNKKNNSKKNNKYYNKNNNQQNKSNKNEVQKIFANNIQNKKEAESSEPVNYSTYIELDMHGSDPHAKRPFDWVPVIRDALFSALERNVDAVRFIPGKGLHSNPEIGPILRILVILTAKRLGFECSFNPNNEGVIICEVSNHSNSNSIVPYIPHKEEQDDLNKNETILKAFGLSKDENLNIDNLAFRAVKSRFPHMPTMCIAIICVKRNPKEALEFAQLFEDCLRSDDNDQQTEEIEQNNDNVNMIKYLKDRYRLDHEVIERVVREKRMQNKSQVILDRIENEIPKNFYNYLTEFLLNFSHVPIESLLDSMKEGFYDPKEITRILNSKSWRGMQNALSVMKVQNKITTDRIDGRPKFIPSIEIDLANASAEKARKTMDKILNGLGNGNFSEVVLILAPQNQQAKKCGIKDVNTFLYKKAGLEGFHVIRTKKADEKNNRYHFMVFNKKEEI